MYKRILLKLSGEALKDPSGKHILDVEYLDKMSHIIKALHDQGIEIGVVIGAGNIWRGKVAESIGIDHEQADYMGMLGTIINAVALCSNLKKVGIEGIVFSPFPPIEKTTVTYSPDAAVQAMSEGKIAFLAGGTGKPFFTTDTAATLRALETKCEAILMGKNGVEGVYDSDPRVNPQAKFIKEITFKEILNMKLQIMDLSAVELIQDSNIVLRIFSMSEPENFLKVALGESFGTICHKGEK